MLVRVRAYIYIYNFGRARAFTCTHMYVMLGKPCCVYVTCIFIYICMSMCVYVGVCECRFGRRGSARAPLRWLYYKVYAS